MSHDSLNINVMELFGVVWTAYVMIVIRKGLPEWTGGGGSDERR